ncbi:unnamed protein product, partial [Nesidiocoris tenuis]
MLVLPMGYHFIFFIPCAFYLCLPYGGGMLWLFQGSRSKWRIQEPLATLVDLNRHSNLKFNLTSNESSHHLLCFRRHPPDISCQSDPLEFH